MNLWLKNENNESKYFVDLCSKNELMFSVIYNLSKRLSVLCLFLSCCQIVVWKILEDIILGHFESRYV